MIFRLGSSFTLGLLTIFFADDANLRVDRVSSTCRLDGDMFATTTVFAFPPRLSFRIHVSSELRYGTSPCMVYGACVWYGV
jgi:hypothetical protein